jgi:predicted heme/steroid binding protein
MGKVLNPQIALGFLLATVFWIGVLGWQASHAPTDSEKRQCEATAAKSGHKTEECKTLWERTTSDPVAFFTFWLVVSTVGLGVSTVLLWRAGEKQLRHARRSVAIQSRDMRASIATSNRAAKAAEDSVLISRQIGEAQVRAYLSCEGATYAVSDVYLSATARVRNHGQSPAIWTEIKSQVVTETSTSVRPDNLMGIQYVRSETATHTGPAIAAGQVGEIFILFLHGQMGKNAHDAVWNDGRFFDIRARMSWRDVFGKTQTQEFVVHPRRGDPKPPISNGERRGEMTAYNHAHRDAEGDSET